MRFAPTEDEKHWLLWDGRCGFCRRCVAWVARRDAHKAFRCLPYQEAPVPPMTPELAAACERAMHVIRADGEVLAAGRAVLFILRGCGWGWVAQLLALPPFVWGVEAIYYVVARNRYFFSRFLFTRE